MYLPSRTSSELHKVSKIEIFRSALRAEMFTFLRATQTFENRNFSLGASRRYGTQTNKGPGTLTWYTTRVHYKGHYKGRYKGHFQNIFGFPRLTSFKGARAAQSARDEKKKEKTPPRAHQKKISK